jgi:hypothetical protein
VFTVLAAVLVYVFVSVSFEPFEAAVFTSYAGPKNALPAVMGLLYGPFGALGVAIGALAAGALLGAPLMAVLFEAGAAAVMSLGAWRLWYTGGKARVIRIKNIGDIARFFAVTAALSAVCAGAAFALSRLGADISWLLVFGSFIVWNALLGIIVIIMMTSIVGVSPVCPRSHPLAPDIDCELPLETESVAVVSDMIDELCFNKILERKRGFQLQSCVEEIILLILAEPTCKNMRLTIRVGDSIIVTMLYDGNARSPFRANNAAYEEQLGLTLIKQRAFRASHSYRGKINKVHIVQ